MRGRKATAAMPPATASPRYRAFMIFSPSRALTKKVPTIEAMMARPPITKGKVTAFRMASSPVNNRLPTSMVAMMVTA